MDPQIFEIFSGNPSGGLLWLESVRGREQAQSQMQARAVAKPGPYFMFCTTTFSITARIDTTGKVVQFPTSDPRTASTHLSELGALSAKANVKRARREYTRILIADDHDVIRRGLRAVLETHPGWVICAECKNGREAIISAGILRPDIAILDVTMPKLNGIEAGRRIRKAMPRIEVLLIATDYTDRLVPEIIGAGIRGCVLKSDPDADVIRAVKCLRQHRPYYSPPAMEPLLREPEHAAIGSPIASRERLTGREREVIQLVSEGKSTKEIAVEMDVSVKTAETHRANIMRKLNIHSLQQLVLYAVRNYIVEP